MNALAGFPLLVLLAGVALLLLMGKYLSARAKGWLAFVVTLASLGGVLGLLPQIAAGQTVDFDLFRWQAEAAFTLHFDGLSLVFALMAAGIGSAILLYCVDYMAHEANTTRFYAFMLTFIAGLLGLVTAANLLAVYLCWEVIGLCSYFLVGFWYQQPAAAAGARKVLLMTHLPGYALLIGILLLYQASGSFLWTDPAVAAQFNTGIFILFLTAAMAKSVMFPLHTWIPEAMNAPTPVSALLHSACYVKAGVYLVARLFTITPWQPGWNVIVMTLGCATMLVGALYALVQTDLKRLLAFSTISQLGYILTAFGLGTPAGALAGAFYVFSHGLFKGTLFLCAGAVQHAAGTRDMRQLGGLARQMPGTARIWLAAAAAIIGVPLTNGFVAKWLLYDAALADGAWPVVVIAWVVSAFTAFYMLKATVSVFYGTAPDGLRDRNIEDATPAMQTGMGVLALACVLFGIVPQWLVTSVALPAARSMGFQPDMNMTFLGLQTSSAGAPVTAGAVIALLALAAAGVVYALTRRPTRSGAAVFTGGDPLPAANAIQVEDFAEFVEDAFQPVLRAVNPDPLYMQVWRAINGLAQRLGGSADRLEQRPYGFVAAAAAVVVLVIWLL